MRIMKHATASSIKTGLKLQPVPCGEMFARVTGNDEGFMEFDAVMSREECEELHRQLTELLYPANNECCLKAEATSSTKALPRWTFTPYTQGTPGGYRGILVDEYGLVAGYLAEDNSVTVATNAD